MIGTSEQQNAIVSSAFLRENALEGTDAPLYDDDELYVTSQPGQKVGLSALSGADDTTFVLPALTNTSTAPAIILHTPSIVAGASQTLFLGSFFSYVNVNNPYAYSLSIHDSNGASHSTAFLFNNLFQGTYKSYTLGAAMSYVTLRSGSAESVDVFTVTLSNLNSGHVYDTASFTVTTDLVNDAPEIVVSNPEELHNNDVVYASTLVTAFDPEGHTLGYLVRDENSSADSAKLTVNGISFLTAGQTHALSAAQFASLRIVAGKGDSLDEISFTAREASTWLLSETQTMSVRTNVTTVADGDYNRDGVVDLADKALYNANFGRSGANLVADGNGDGSVDSADYTVWRDNLGLTAEASDWAPALGASALSQGDDLQAAIDDFLMATEPNVVQATSDAQSLLPGSLSVAELVPGDHLVSADLMIA